MSVMRYKHNIYNKRFNNLNPLLYINELVYN